MILYSLAKDSSDLQGILDLQKANLKSELTAESIEKEGFVTVSHTFEELYQLNVIEKHTIAKVGETVVGYALAMNEKSRTDIAVLAPMFDLFDNLVYKNKLVSQYNYMVVGQVCVAKNYRGQSIFDKLYENYKLQHQQNYDFAITEIAVSNIRSRKAHQRIGFDEIHFFTDCYGIEWVIMVWDFRG